MALRRFVVPVTVDASGDAEAYSPVLSGKLVSIRYVKPGSNGFEDGVDFALTSDVTGATLWAEDNVNASATRLPRFPVQGAAGADAEYLDSVTPEVVLGPFALSQDRVKIVVASGTAGAGGETGTFHITIDG
jgi:hypothetical protein